VEPPKRWLQSTSVQLDFKLQVLNAFRRISVVNICGWCMRLQQHTACAGHQVSASTTRVPHGVPHAMVLMCNSEWMCGHRCKSTSCDDVAERSFPDLQQASVWKPTCRHGKDYQAVVPACQPRPAGACDDPRTGVRGPDEAAAKLLARTVEKAAADALPPDAVQVCEPTIVRGNERLHAVSKCRLVRHDTPPTPLGLRNGRRKLAGAKQRVCCLHLGHGLHSAWGVACESYHHLVLDACIVMHARPPHGKTR